MPSQDRVPANLSATTVLFTANGKTSQGTTGAVVAFERICRVRRIRLEQIGCQQRRDYYHDNAWTRRCRSKGFPEQYA